MKSTARGRGAALDAIQQLCERPRHQRGLLRLAHLGRRHHLHRAGDLRGAGDRLDAPANFTRAGHNSPSRCPFPGLLSNSSAAAFNSAFNASLIAFSFPILASNSAFRVVRKSVSLLLELLDPLHRHVIHVPVLHGPDHGHLDLDRESGCIAAA